MKSIVTTLLLFFIAYTLQAQNFYVNTGGVPSSLANNTYRLSIVACDTIKDSLSLSIYTCPPTYQQGTGIDSTYNDIAIDKYNNMWYVTQSGYLYKRKLDDTSSCQYIGDFVSKLASVNGLVIDSADNVFAASNGQDTCTIYKYHPNTGFSTVGKLPKGIYCNGDLFFFQQRLFMTANTTLKGDSTFLYEINLKAPEQSCYYMALDSLQPWGAFTVKNGVITRTYVSHLDINNYTSYIIEIDIPNKKILDTFCHYPFAIRGAANYYEVTGDSTQCPYIPNTIAQADARYGNNTIDVYNPSRETIRMNTNMSNAFIQQITLYDIYGRRTKSFLPSEFPNNLRIAELPSGIYLLHIRTKEGEQWMRKVLKSDN